MFLWREIERVDQLAALGRVLVQNISQLTWYDSFPSSIWKTTSTVYYSNMETPNSALDQQLKDRDIFLGVLKE